MIKTLAFLASLVLAATSQAATTLTTSMGLVEGSSAFCFVLNASKKPIEVDSVSFVRPDGSVVAGQTSTCSYPNPISPGLTCRDTIAAGGAMRCVIVTKGNAKSIRGTLVMFNPAGAVSILETR